MSVHTLTVVCCGVTKVSISNKDMLIEFVYRWQGVVEDIVIFLCKILTRPFLGDIMEVENSGDISCGFCACS